MSEFYVKIGDQVRFEKTVGESDVYLFAGITGDLSVNHVNDAYMKNTAYGQRIAHGALMVGFMSTTSTMMIEKSDANRGDETAVSLGYDGVRFLKGVFINDTVAVTYTIASVDTERRRSQADIEVTNQHGELVAVGKHHLKWVPNSG